MIDDSGESPPGLRHRWGFVSLVGICVAWTVWFRGGMEPVEGTLFHLDHLVWYTRGLTLSAGVLLVLVLWDQIGDNHSAEAYACLLVILAGTSLVAASNDLVSLFLSLEMVSIPTYVILYLPRRDRHGGEATLKYFLLSVFSSALVLYGMSWLFGAAGTTNFTAIQQVLAGPPHAAAGSVGISFAVILAGFCIRI